MFDFANSFGGGGGGFDLSSLFAKISSISPEFTPFPMLQQLSAGPTAGSSNLGGMQSDWSFINPEQAPTPVPIPGDPSKIQNGPLAGVKLPVPGAATGKTAAPLTAQQMAALSAMQGHGTQDQQRPMQAPSAGVIPGAKSVTLNPLTLAAMPAVRQIPSLADILGMRR